MDAVIRLEEAALFVATAAVGYFLARAAKLYIELANRNRVPKRTRVYKSHHFDSTVWDKFNPRDDDVFIVTAYKSVRARVAARDIPPVRPEPCACVCS